MTDHPWHAPSPDDGHEALRAALAAGVDSALEQIAEIRQAIADIIDGKGDRLVVTEVEGGWTWQRIDSQGRTLGQADKPYSRKADAERGGQRANPGL